MIRLQSGGIRREGLIMKLAKARKTLIQCDFDGTITEEEVSYLLLDSFASKEWRQLLQKYTEGKITVNILNTEAFAMIKADRESLVRYINGKVKIRNGFRELVDYCQRQDYRFVIVSNGQDFYIEAILHDIGLEDIQVFAAQSRFLSEGLKVRYIGPDGTHLSDGFKEAYTASFLKDGYQIIYIGNGASDYPAAKRCHHIFAKGELLTYCRKADLDCNAFSDFNDIVKQMEVSIFVG